MPPESIRAATMPPESALEVLATGPLTLVQDAGRPGWAHLGVPASGAADRGALRAANRLVGNEPGAAVLESVLGGLVVRAWGTLLVAVTGAPTSAWLERGGSWAPIRHPSGSSMVVRNGEVLRLDPPATGLRTVLAVRGGIEVAAVLGSRSADVLSGLGPAPIRPGDVLHLGDSVGEWPAADLLPSTIGWRPSGVLTVLRGPHDDRFGAAGWRQLVETAWVTSARSNRVGVRLDAPDPAAPGWAAVATGRSEGMVAGAVQVPPGGQPVVFLRDHPVTGGYPVIGVLTEASIDLAAQLRPGDPVRFGDGDGPGIRGAA
ncbi:biotin-dependent carboxyltransferase family protein [Herbiconiux sp. P18]|uniref:5-oxoprolinase subunit C family protein n=1 Tax=Herbiconiux liangxiaofengii TaxID=3342795 RepID=UPI0035BBB169